MNNGTRGVGWSPSTARSAKADCSRIKRHAKAITEDKMAKQLDLFCGTAENPQGINAEVAAGLPVAATCAMPKPETKEETVAPTVMTMEDVARKENLVKAFKKVASNKGAPGADRQTIVDVREHIGELIPELQVALLTGAYEPGEIRRVWLPHGLRRKVAGNVVWAFPTWWTGLCNRPYYKYLARSTNRLSMPAATGSGLGEVATRLSLKPHSIWRKGMST